jgi:hypothetical protein
MSIKIIYENTIWSCRLEPPDHGSGARRVVTGRRLRMTGFVHSRKAARGNRIEWESKGERNFLIIEEFEARTRTIIAQPHVLHVWSDREEFSHIPDPAYAHSSANFSG